MAAAATTTALDLIKRSMRIIRAIGKGEFRACDIGGKFRQLGECCDAFGQLFANTLLGLLRNGSPKEGLRIQLTRHQLQVKLQIHNQLTNLARLKRVSWQQGVLRVLLLNVLGAGHGL